MKALLEIKTILRALEEAKRLEKREKRFQIVCCHFLQFQVCVCMCERERESRGRERDEEREVERNIEKFFFVEKLKSFF